MRKYLALFIILFFTFVINANKVNATSSSILSGWLWGGTQDDTGNTTSVGWTNVSRSDYALNIPAQDGNLSGYIWNENLGWISFNPSDLSGCPDGNCFATKTGNSLIGWARILSIKNALTAGNSGEWQGWIKLNGSGYGLQINPSDGTFPKGATTSYVWSDELGWIDFSRSVFKTLIAEAVATPNLIAETTTVTIKVSVSGTATGNITYESSCDGTNFATPAITTEPTYSFTCNYSSSSTATIKIMRDGLSVTTQAPVAFGCFSYVCNNDYTTCNRIIIGSGCITEAVCKTTCRNPTWKEIKP